MSSATDECRRPRFFYGRAERVIDGKRGYQICLVDMKTEQVAWFECQKHLAAAVGQLVSKVPAESETRCLSSLLPGRKVTSELLSEDLEDLLNEEDILADRGMENLAFDFLEGQAIRKHHIRNFRKIELDHLFQESLSEREIDCSVEVRDMEEGECSLQGPFFNAGDFTDDTSQITAGISVKSKFMDVSALSAQSKAAKEDLEGLQKEVEIVLKMAETEKRSHGWTGMIDSGPVDMDACLQESALR
jgi:hypothetical protein